MMSGHSCAGAETKGDTKNTKMHTKDTGILVILVFAFVTFVSAFLPSPIFRIWARFESFRENV
jgi:hypothetical protein